MGQVSPLKSFGILLAAQGRMWRNSLRKATVESPIRVVILSACALAVTAAIYWVLHRTFAALHMQETYGGHAIHFLLLLLFLALTVMLFFSNAVILFSSLTRNREMDMLTAAPVPTSTVFAFKFFESMAHASWALLLLALPLIAAFTTAGELPLWYLFAFLAFLFTFIPIPAAGGAIAALLVGRFAPRKPGRILAAGGVVILAGLVWWGISLWREGSGKVLGPWQALDTVFEKLRLLDNPLMPGYWLTQGLESASNHRRSEAAFFYLVVLVNAVFACTWAIVLGTRWMAPVTAALSARSGRPRLPRTVLSRVVDTVFAFLPADWRLLIAKDVRTFLRDPAQWSQCLIILGLLTLYVLNGPRMAFHFQGGQAQSLLAGLNVLAPGLITAVFTSRFVFPMLSLEGRRMWFLGTAPVTRGGVVSSKFFYSLFLSLPICTGLVATGALRLDLPTGATLFQVLMAACMCLGLSAIAVGAGARWPNYEEENAAKIAGGFGGTINLLISLGFLVALVIPPGIAAGGLLLTSAGDATPPVAPELLIAGSAVYVILVTAAAVAAPLALGIRAFQRWEP